MLIQIQPAIRPASSRASSSAPGSPSGSGLTERRRSCSEAVTSSWIGPGPVSTEPASTTGSTASGSCPSTPMRHFTVTSTGLTRIIAWTHSAFSPAEATAADRAAVEGHRRAEAVVTAAVRAEEATAAVRALGEDESCGVVVLTGSGRAFCVGQDLKEHVQLDVGSTNSRMMEELLQLMPENARTLAEAGAEALDIYLRFLGDCLQTAEAALWSPNEAMAG